jgi:hypothetical protein
MSGPRNPPRLTREERLAHPRVCKKHVASTGDPCPAFAIKGADYCVAHGGRTPGGKAAAQKRLLEAADSAAAVLVSIMTDQKASASDRRQAARDLLDRAGLSPRQVVEMDVTSHDGDSALDLMLAELLSRAEADDSRG